MQAQDIMTKDVVTVSPDAPTSQVAQRLLEHKISAVPVTGSSGIVIGMVSEGDLIGRSDADRQERRDWWLSLIAEGEALPRRRRITPAPQRRSPLAKPAVKVRVSVTRVRRKTQRLPKGNARRGCVDGHQQTGNPRPFE
jgi:CBS-domain-containing membrane protein